MNIKRGEKKGQFYIIAAIIIAIIIIGLASISNYTRTKKEPQKFFELGNQLNLEGVYIIDSTNYNRAASLNTNIESYLDLFITYSKLNTDEQFNLVVLYGSIVNANEINARVYSTMPQGGVSVSLGGTSFEIQGEGMVNSNDATATINPSDNTVNITLTDSNGYQITQTVPVLSDNNFVFLMTTNEGFNSYVQSNLGV